MVLRLTSPMSLFHIILSQNLVLMKQLNSLFHPILSLILSPISVPMKQPNSVEVVVVDEAAIDPLTDQHMLCTAQLRFITHRAITPILLLAVATHMEDMGDMGHMDTTAISTVGSSTPNRNHLESLVPFLYS